MKRVLLSLALLLGMVMPSHADIESGTCGDNLTWVLSDNYELTISGSGAMTDYFSSAPWNSYRSKITKVTLPSGLTSIGHRAFYYCSGLTSATIPESVTSIGYDAFYYCDRLDDVYCFVPTPLTKNRCFSHYGNLHVLPGSGDAYRAAQYWKDFNIIEDLETGIEETPLTATQCTDGKYLRQGRLVIRHDGREYNASGVRQR